MAPKLPSTTRTARWVSPRFIAALALAAMLSQRPAGAQQPIPAPPIDAERPLFARSPAVLAPGYIQIESGVALEQDERGVHTERVRQRDLTFPALLGRFGLLPGFELRAGAEYLNETILDIKGAEVGRLLGLRRIALGTKIRIRDEDGPLPEAAFLVTLGLPIGHDGLRPVFTAPSFELSLRNSITGQVKLMYSVGGNWDGIDSGGQGTYAAGVAAMFTQQATAFAEAHGIFTSGESPQHAIRVGIAYRAATSIQIDLAGGKSLTRSGPDSFLTLGISFRLPRIILEVEA